MILIWPESSPAARRRTKSRRPPPKSPGSIFTWQIAHRYRILKADGLPHYGAAVDASGQTADGQTFLDLARLKAILLKDPDALARNLTAKLLTYATGRAPAGVDRIALDEIVGRVRGTGYGVRSIIHEVVQSDMMRGRP